LENQYTFTEHYNSRDIEQIRGRSYDLLVCSGVTAIKWKANRFPAEDRAAIDRLLESLAQVTASRVILISTVDVYPTTAGVDEWFDPHGRANHAYGTNRLHVEDTLQRLFDKLHIVRLPAVFGPGLKKNALYDLIHDNALEAIQPASEFQYYDVRRLWTDLQIVLANELRVVNFATEPIRTQAIVNRSFPGKEVGAQAGAAVRYDVRTRYGGLFGGRSGYMYSAETVLTQIGDWVHWDRSGRAA
jgi:hypothetical protein